MTSPLIQTWELFTFRFWHGNGTWGLLGTRPLEYCHITQLDPKYLRWRTGSGNWPVPITPDNVPSVVDIGQGSPTGVLAGNTFGFSGNIKKKKCSLGFDGSFGTCHFYFNDTGWSQSYKNGTPRKNFYQGPPSLWQMSCRDDGGHVFSLLVAEDWSPNVRSIL